eukprot:CAMPEP_0185779918 /NCGR_PEP_ID=MMETSP1174-20130828/97446_1 /TAXON_ID=35687 /ORGANISM="Dictyocha speculum, Strain CCMP1381" /LENGTH=49 /DNA_ID=CAMNT_0028469241 /DNA_START=38 /DNA_END=187 /DNA_ORIENTATION=-
MITVVEGVVTPPASPVHQRGCLGRFKVKGEGGEHEEHASIPQKKKRICT